MLPRVLARLAATHQCATFIPHDNKRETSAGTSHQMVRLVFRPYTQVKRSICTSEPLRTSTRVSSGFILLEHSSPSFGSQPACSYSNLQSIASAALGRSALQSCYRTWHLCYFHYASGFYTPKHSHASWTPWSVFQDGSLSAISSASLARWWRRTRDTPVRRVVN